MSLRTRYIPQIPVTSDARKAIGLVRKAELAAVAISLNDFFTQNGELNEFFRKAKSAKLHGYLNYDDDIILTTDMRDSLCDMLSADRFAKIVNCLQPDCVTTFDTYCYDDQPSFITQMKMVEALKKTCTAVDRIDLDVLGLTLGPPNDLFEWYSRCLVEAGVKNLSIPCYEQRVRGRKTQYVRAISKRIKFLKTSFPDTRIMLLSVSPSRASRVFSADYYSSLSWFMPKEKDPVKKNNMRLERLLRYKRQSTEYASQEMVGL
jgi:hypothetical protein